MKLLNAVIMFDTSNYPSDFFVRLFYPFLLSLTLLFALNWLAAKLCNLFEYDFEYVKITLWAAASIVLYIIILNLLW